jgi:prepilin-type N-terminal cleavage/methylation domain-containing protein
MIMQKMKEHRKAPLFGYKRHPGGFSLVEIMIVVVLIGILAAFGVPGYEKMINKSRERNAILGLISINQANSVYFAKKGVYYPGAGLSLAAINSGLSIDVKALDMAYSYTRSAPGAYIATSDWAGSGPFTVGVNQNPVVLGTNPYCSAGACPTLP